jgi:hypothetical protein
MTHRYRVETVCHATVREVWMIRSCAPLSHAALEAIIASNGQPPGNLLVVDCIEDATQVDEGDRHVLAVQSLGLLGES